MPDQSAATSRGFPAPEGLAQRTLHEDEYVVLRISKHERRLLDPTTSGVAGRFCLLHDAREGFYELVRYTDV